MKLPNFIERKPTLLNIIAFLRFFAFKVRTEQVHVSAGYLSYVTLMSLVPLMVVNVVSDDGISNLCRY